MIQVNETRYSGVPESDRRETFVLPKPECDKTYSEKLRDVLFEGFCTAIYPVESVAMMSKGETFRNDRQKVCAYVCAGIVTPITAVVGGLEILAKSASLTIKTIVGLE